MSAVRSFRHLAFTTEYFPLAVCCPTRKRVPLPYKILVVEDNSDSREMLAILLGNEGFTVLTAEDGRAGIGIAMVEYPDLIITDINMPDLDGIEMIRRLREHPKCSDVPIMVLTALSDIDRAWAVKAGANSFMTKPFEFVSLTTAIKQLLSL